jgi:hypothetical protein
MSKQIKAVMIDVTNREVKEVTITPELSSYYQLIECDLVQLAPLDETCEDFIAFIDEEAKLKNPQKDYFKFDGCLEAYCGNAVIVGVLSFDEDEDEMDDTKDVPDGTLERIASSIQFFKSEELPSEMTEPFFKFYSW